MIDYKKQGKKNKRIGADFERRVRKDLESKGWIVSKWQNNVEFYPYKIFPHLEEEKTIPIPPISAKLIPAKPGRFRMMQTGFPDFIVYRYKCNGNIQKIANKITQEKIYEIIFVECKTNGYLSKIEKEKARWYLKNNYCSSFIIASKDGRKIKYTNFENYGKKKV